ncbi:hypothetical protein JMUB6875_03010 [Nocardia sp. JMUB6875]|uniref:CsbD family protein n=1 Tax=Nocardia sp. JMUB6875 TaxID=3158170 RepID=UPI0032E74155
MSLSERLSHQTQATMGAVKRMLGRATGNPRMHREGRSDQIAGNIKKAGDSLGDAFKR